MRAVVLILLILVTVVDVPAQKQINSRRLRISVATPMSTEDRPGEPVTKILNCFFDDLPAQFPGDLNLFLKEQICYPDSELVNSVEGRVVVRFKVLEDGSIVQPEIIRSVSKGIDAEALRLVGIMPKWKPARRNGKAIGSLYYFPIRFILD